MRNISKSPIFIEERFFKALRPAKFPPITSTLCFLLSTFLSAVLTISLRLCSFINLLTYKPTKKFSDDSISFYGFLGCIGRESLIEESYRDDEVLRNAQSTGLLIRKPIALTAASRTLPPHKLY
jgi:hypothetical protein